MSEFLRNAESILDGAAAALASGGQPSEMVILVGRDGVIRIVAEPDWPLDALEAYHSARMAYRVSGRDGRVRVEGRCGGASCMIVADPPASVARRLLAGHAWAPNVPLACLPPAAS
ncbi:MAG TPA: hypothetical protein VLE22_19620 [Bryobacteraceae bacterium]|nr:hypothetical protein [Bryobacteraceae bacterium]